MVFAVLIMEKLFLQHLLIFVQMEMLPLYQVPVRGHGAVKDLTAELQLLVRLL